MQLLPLIPETPWFDKIQRNRAGSRAHILSYLESKGTEWSSTRQCLRDENDEMVMNVWSEDLQDLVREGYVECLVKPSEMSMKSLVRIPPAAVNSGLVRLPPAAF